MAMQSTDESLLRSLERGGLIDITTTGRRTGEPRRLEIAFHNIAGRLYISGIPSRTRRSWLANLEAEPRLTLHLKRGVKADLPARARIVDDIDERRTILTEVARNWRRADVETMVRYSPLIEVTLDRPLLSRSA